MRICLVTPAPAGSRKGNRVTAERWAGFLRQLGHPVRVEQRYSGRQCDLMVALHARRSYPSISRYRRRFPRGHLVVALTGTDLYSDLHSSPRARESIVLADRLVLLQPAGVADLTEEARPKARVIYQSVSAPPRPAARAARGPWAGSQFRVCVLGHLRPVKDPFRTAMAVRRLPPASRIAVLHVGDALTGAMAERARREEARNSRYHWLGELARGQALEVLASSHLLALTSRMEGGANVISEAVVASVPVIASRIPGSVGLLGEEYPGYFPMGDTARLAALLRRVEQDRDFYGALRTWCNGLRPLFEPDRELRAWRNLLAELDEETARPVGQAVI